MDEELMDLSEYLSLKSKISQLEKKLKHARTEIAHLKSKLSVKKGESKKIKIIKLIESGVSIQEIIKTHGFNREYVYEISQLHRRMKDAS